MRRSINWIAVLTLTTALGACGGGSGHDGPMQLVNVGSPIGVPMTITTAIQITGTRLDEHGDLRMRIVGIGDLACTPTSETTATLTLPANTLAAGAYDVLLFTPDRFTNTLVGGLVINAQANLSSCTPNSFDANFNSAFTIVGTGMLAPISAHFLDAMGQQVGPNIVMTLNPGGASASGTSPVVPGFVGPMTGTVQITSGDGQSALAGMPITVSCALCENRSIDGTGNNLSSPAFGNAGIRLRRQVAAAYADGFSAPSGPTRPNARLVSRTVCAQGSNPANSVSASDMFWLWGQFIDHDIDLTGGTDPAEPFSIAVPLPDPLFDPFNSGTVVIPLTRSHFDATTGTSNARQQLNDITSWLDGSNVYGSDAVRQAALRTNDGTGRLRTTAGNLPPFNTGGLPNADNGGDPTALFLAGDVRANEQVGLTSLHIVFMREHNRLADQIRAANPHLTGEQVYQSARRWVGALLQVITYQEFLPTMLGSGAIAPYGGYSALVQPDIDNVFSTACYRFGHSLVSSTVRRLDVGLAPIPQGDLALRDAFFSPSRIINEGGIDPILRGMAVTGAQELDVMIVDDLRNFLFGPPGAGGLDLAALNIQRGRDHGLPDYNTVRQSYGLAAKADLNAVTTNANVQANLNTAYPLGITTLDVWLGGLAEDHLAGAIVGELLYTVFKSQFERVRDGDRFWYARVFAGDALAALEATTLADVIRRNTTITTEIPDNVFIIAAP